MDDSRKTRGRLAMLVPRWINRFFGEGNDDNPIPDSIKRVYDEIEQMQPAKEQLRSKLHNDAPWVSVAYPEWPERNDGGLS
jgi:uncharacterized phage-associated protein